mmetsp:Transcript_8848/g.12541  ORF Transcript_8848/g.12541 Transcript_8848/m.12541 type:complete len:203 (-) Transcript_8848:1149-1757(-)
MIVCLLACPLLSIVLLATLDGAVLDRSAGGTAWCIVEEWFEDRMLVGVVKFDTLSDSFPCGIDVISRGEGGFGCGKRIHDGTDVFPAALFCLLFRGSFLAVSGTTTSFTVCKGAGVGGSSFASSLVNTAATINSAVWIAPMLEGGESSPISPSSTFQRVSLGFLSWCSSRDTGTFSGIRSSSIATGGGVFAISFAAGCTGDF